MTSVLLDRDTRKMLLSKAGRVTELVESSYEGLAPTEKAEVMAMRRWILYHRLENAVLDLANALPVGVEDYQARQMFVFLTSLRRSLDLDATASDKTGRVNLAAMQMGDVARRMQRRLQRSAFDDAGEAAQYVIEQLDRIGTTELTRLLDVSPSTIRAWRSGKPVKQNAERVKLIAELVSYLRDSMTQLGVVMWFDNETDRFDGRSPLQLLTENVRGAWGPLVSYARGGRG